MRARPTSTALLAAAALTAPLAAALTALPTAPLTAQEIAFTRHRLENGLTVIFHEDHRLPLVAVNLWYGVGSKDEPPGRSGFAHLFEHLMFMGTEKVPIGEFDARMERVGGHNNATTSEDRTNYFESGPRELLDLFLFLEADRMAGLAKAMDQEKLDVQRGVVRNERRQSYENRPYGRMELEIPAWIYPEGHPYRWPVIGSHEDLESATVADVVGFFEQFYFPANASLVVAGDFDPHDARELVDRYFAPLPKRAGVPRDPAPPALIDGTIRKTLRDGVRLPLVAFVWHSPALYASGDADLDVLANVLGGGKSSRLWRSLVYEKKIAQQVDVHQQSRYLGGEFRIEVYGVPGDDAAARAKTLDEIERAVDAELAELRRDGPTRREVERALNGIETSFQGQLEPLGQRADLLNQYQFHFDDPGAIAADLARYREVTPQSVRDVGARVLDPARRLIVHVLPDESSAAGGER